jgi:ATP-binding cassette subfamily C protein
LRDTIKKLRGILTRREKIQVGLLLIAIIAMAFSQAIGVASVLPFISLVMDQNMVFENRWLNMAYETFNFTSVNRFIIFIGVAMFVIIFFSNAISAFATWLKLRFVWMNNHRLSRRLLEKYLAMPYAFFLNQNSADLSKNVLTEVNNLTNSFLIPLLNVITRGMVTLIMLTMLFWVDVAVTVIAILFLGGAYILIILRVNRNLKTRGKLRIEANQMRFKAVSEAFGGIKEIKVMNREPYFLDRYSTYSYRLARLMSWNAVIGQIPRFALEAIAFGGIIVFVLALLLTRENAGQVIPLVSLFAFAGYRLMPALQDLFTSFAQMQFNRAVLDRIYTDFKRKEKDLPTGTYAKLNKDDAIYLKKEISLNGVSFNYPNTKTPVISNLNLIIPVNSAVAFVGPTGAGKTTLVDIILGLLTPGEGKLLVDGVVINKDNIIKWQKNIGYVPQHIYLSDDTVARNIAFGVADSDIDQNSLEKVARIANIHDFITNEMPEGYNTLVGERGIRLSGGQRQRIGIARALYHDPDVLVFDEATSALDGATEDAVLQAMNNAAELKTLIVIAHRLTTVKNCDKIYMLEKGRITAEGRYEELLSSNEQFKSMAKNVDKSINQKND